MGTKTDLSSSQPLGPIRLRLATVAQWTSSVPTYTPKVAVCAKSVLSWAFPGPPWAINFGVPASLCVAVVPLIPPLHN
jgi:hypothetical protein